MFAYCGNNPVNYSDPTGEVAIEVLIGILAGKVKEALIDGLIGGIIDGVCTFAIGGSLGEIGKAFGKGFISSFLCGLWDEFFIVDKLATTYSTIKECRDSGAGWGKSVLAGAISLFSSYSFKKDLNGNILRFVDFVFNMGSSLVSTGITEGIIRTSSSDIASSAGLNGLQGTAGVTPSASSSGGSCGGTILRITY